MLKQVLQFVTLLVFVAAAPLSMAQRTPLLVYTALETDQLKAFKDSIESMVKDVEIRWVRLDRRHHRSFSPRRRTLKPT